MRVVELDSIRFSVVWNTHSIPKLVSLAAYSMALFCCITLFPLRSLQLRTHAPGLTTRIVHFQAPGSRSCGVGRLTITEVQLNIRDDVIEIDADDELVDRNMLT
jgi:hypothetical protein